MYLRGSSQCKLVVSIYDTGSSFIVENNRLSGDAEGFRSVYKQLKRELSTDENNGYNGNSNFNMASGSGIYHVLNDQPKILLYSESFTDDSSPILAFTDILSDSESYDLLQPLVRMAQESTIDAKIEASRIMCDLSQNENMQQALCESGCLQALISLTIVSAPEVAKQHAILALAHLPVSLSCQEALIDAGILPAILALISDTSATAEEVYHTREIKREGARILANLSARFSTRVVAVVGHRIVQGWIDTVHGIKDERLKLHSERARDSLSTAILV